MSHTAKQCGFSFNLYIYNRETKWMLANSHRRFSHCSLWIGIWTESTNKMEKKRKWIENTTMIETNWVAKYFFCRVKQNATCDKHVDVCECEVNKMPKKCPSYINKLVIRMLNWIERVWNGVCERDSFYMNGWRALFLLLLLWFISPLGISL